MSVATMFRPSSSTPGPRISRLPSRSRTRRITALLGTNGAGALASTAADVAADECRCGGQCNSVTAYVYGGTTGAGIVQPRALVDLSDS